MLLPGPGVAWDEDRVTVERLGQEVVLAMDLAADGSLRGVRTLRWGNPDGGAFAEHGFAAVVDEERRFGGHVIPSRVRVAWEGHDEFFRARVESAEFR